MSEKFLDKLNEGLEPSLGSDEYPDLPLSNNNNNNGRNDR